MSVVGRITVLKDAQSWAPDYVTFNGKELFKCDLGDGTCGREIIQDFQGGLSLLL